MEAAENLAMCWMSEEKGDGRCARRINPCRGTFNHCPRVVETREIQHLQVRQCGRVHGRCQFNGCEIHEKCVFTLSLFVEEPLSTHFKPLRGVQGTVAVG